MIEGSCLPRDGRCVSDYCSGLFIAYSTGTLPFDPESDRIYATGFSYQLY